MERDACHVVGEPAIVERWDLRDEVRDELRLDAEVHQWLHHREGAKVVLGTADNMRAERSRSLPLDDPKFSARSTFLAFRTRVVDKGRS